MSQEERQHLEELLRIFRLRLAKLHKQAASFGLHIPGHLQIEIQNIQEEIVPLESRLASIRALRSDESMSPRCHRAQFVLLILLAGLPLFYLFALPYLRLRLYAEATLWALPAPAAAQQLAKEMNVSVRCGRVVSTMLYQTDDTWADLKAHYTAQFRQAGWFIQPSETVLLAFWSFEEPHNQNTPQLTVTIRPQIFGYSLLQDKDRSKLNLREERYVMILEYIGDQNDYRTCFHD